MNRDDLFALAKARGWTPGTPLTAVQRSALRNAIRNQLTQVELAPARVLLDGNARPITADEAADALVEEF